MGSCLSRPPAWRTSKAVITLVTLAMGRSVAASRLHRTWPVAASTRIAPLAFTPAGAGGAQGGGLLVGAVGLGPFGRRVPAPQDLASSRVDQDRTLGLHPGGGAGHRDRRTDGQRWRRPRRGGRA